MRRLRLLCVLILVVVSCGGEAVEGETPASTEGSAGCDEPLAQPGAYERLDVFGDVETPYWMVVPEVYPEVAPTPLYLHLASGAGDHDAFFEVWRPHLDDLDGVMAFVNTSSGAPPRGRGSTETLMALVDSISGRYCVDPTRIHVLGTSWSSGMAARLACEASGRIASFVSALGGAGASGCTPERPVPLLSFTGDPDRRAITAFVRTWAETSRCDPEPIVDDLGTGVLRKTYENCQADVVLYDIEGMGHVWPVHEARGSATHFMAEYEEVDYLEEALEFFSEHPLP